MIKWLYKWLPIICGCHCMDSRSFHYKGVKFPVCARCTGNLIGMFISFIFIFFINPSIILCIVLMIPLIADGLIQRLTPYESGNIRRLISGILFGYALVSLFIIKPGVFFFNYGYSIGQSFKA